VSIRIVPAALVVLAIALAGCGGDDSSSGNEEQSAATTTTEQQTGTTTSESDAPNVQLDEQQEPVPKRATPPGQRSGNAPSYEGQRQIPKEKLKAVERPVYEQSRYLCRRLGVDGMRREYRIDSTDPEEVARAVAARTYQREIRDAVYSGCLAGLRAGN
jgi:hypothetical protein